MNATEKDTAGRDAKRAPRQRRSPAAAGKSPAAPRGFAKARRDFEARAQDWLAGRPGKVMQIPQDLPAIAALGVPCSCHGSLIYRDGQDGHTIAWKRKAEGAAAGHWASGITASCDK
jgi:hypothetical protein